MASTAMRRGGPTPVARTNARRAAPRQQRAHPRSVAPPGTRVEYSGGGFQILQALVEDVTGQPFATLMRSTLLDPLGMACSTFEQPLPAAWEPDAVTGYDRAGDALPGRWRVQPELAAGGCWTTPTDLLRVGCRNDRAGVVLDETAREAMLTSQRVRARARVDTRRRLVPTRRRQRGFHRLDGRSGRVKTSGGSDGERHRRVRHKRRHRRDDR